MKTAADNIPMSFDLTKITQFNLALIYGFDPETLAINEIKEFDESLNKPQSRLTKERQGEVEAKHKIASLLGSCGQYQDMFDAYLYAQDEILKAIEQNGIDNIAPQQLLNWLNEIHKRIARTLTMGINDAVAGEYTSKLIFRWLPGHQANIYVQFCLMNRLSKDDALNALENSNIDRKTAGNFLDLLLRLRDDDTVVISDDIKSTFGKNLPGKSPLTLYKLAALYYANKLSEQEKTTVDKLLVICMLPQKYPQAMLSYAEDLLKAWRSCDKNDLRQVAQLCYQAFFNLTEVHPYFNANGRTATCLMNIILRSFGLPSILMRNPGERSNSNSSYSQAIAMIKIKPELMIEHLHQRIQEASKGYNFNDGILAETIELRVKWGSIIRAIKQEFPDYNINSCMMRFENETRINISKNFSDSSPEDMVIKGLEMLIQQFTSLYNNAHAEKTITAAKEARKAKKAVEVQQNAFETLSITSAQYTDEMKKNIVQKLQELTAYSGWKTYKKNGLTILLTLKDEDTAKQLVNAFDKTQALRAEKTRNVNTKEHVVQLDQIKSDKLLALTSKTFASLHDKGEQSKQQNRM